MFGHLGAKTGEQGRKMQQLSEKRWIFGGLERVGGDAGTRKRSRVPPLKKLQRKGLEIPPPPGAPNSTWKLVELKLVQWRSLVVCCQVAPEVHLPALLRMSWAAPRLY